MRPTHIFHGHLHLAYPVDAELAPGLETLVTGLGDDGTGHENRLLVNLATLAAAVQARPGD